MPRLQFIPALAIHRTKLHGIPPILQKNKLSQFLQILCRHYWIKVFNLYSAWSSFWKRDAIVSNHHQLTASLFYWFLWLHCWMTWTYRIGTITHSDWKLRRTTRYRISTTYTWWGCLYALPLPRSNARFALRGHCLMSIAPLRVPIFRIGFEVWVTSSSKWVLTRPCQLVFEIVSFIILADMEGTTNLCQWWSIRSQILSRQSVPQQHHILSFFLQGSGSHSFLNLYSLHSCQPFAEFLLLPDSSPCKSSTQQLLSWRVPRLSVPVSTLTRSLRLPPS